MKKVDYFETIAACDLKLIDFLTLTQCHLQIIIISIFKEDNVFSITASLPYGPPVNTDIDYYQTFLPDLFIFASVAKLAVRYVFGEEKPVLAL